MPLTALQHAEKWASHRGGIEGQSAVLDGFTVTIVAGPWFFTTPAGSPGVTVLIEVRDINAILVTQPYGPIHRQFNWVLGDTTAMDGMNPNQERAYVRAQVERAIRAHIQRHAAEL